MLRLLSRESTSIASAAALVSLLSFGSRLLGVLRDRLLASTFGAGDILDAYYAAFRIPDFVFALVVLGALSAGFIPVFTKLDRERAWEFANAVLGILLLLLGSFAVLFILFAPALVAIITPGFHEEKLALAVTLSRIMALSPVLLGVSNVFGGILQSRRRFFIYALSPVLYNLGIIIGIVGFVRFFGPTGLAWGVVFGALMHLALQVWATRALGFRFRITFTFSTELRRLFILSTSRVGGIMLSQLDLFVATIVATTLASGSLSIFQFANNIQILPIGLIGIPFALAAFPALSEATGGQLDRFRAELASTTSLVLFFVLPATVLLLLLRAQIVRIVLGGAAFDWNSTILTFQTLQWFAISLFAQSLIPLFVRALYALEAPVIPLLSGLLGMIVSIIGYLVFPRYFGVAGLALAVSSGALLQCAVLYGALQQKLHAFEDGALLRSLGRLLFASFGMAGWVQLIKAPAAALFGTSTFFGVLGQMLIASFVGVVMYGFLCWLTHAAELAVVVSAIRRRLVRLAPAPSESVEALEY